MELYFDLDCLSKLHFCKAFDKAMTLFQEPRTLHAIESFQYKASSLAKKKSIEQDLRLVYEGIANRKLLEGFEIHKNGPAYAGMLEKLSKIHNIDPGEALLLVLASQSWNNSCILTGDTRFLNAVQDNIQPIKDAIGNVNCKFIHFLHIIKQLCHADSENIKLFTTETAFLCDKSLMSIFGGGNPTIEHIDDGITSYTASFDTLCSL